MVGAKFGGSEELMVASGEGSGRARVFEMRSDFDL